MSYNKSLLTMISQDLKKKKKPSRPSVPRNQWQHPGEVTTIPSNNITMDGVSYPVLGVPNVGTPQMMYPDQQYSYPGASNVTEYPKMRMGGLLSRSVKCRNCGHSWKSTDGGKDPLTCHKCGYLNLMQKGGEKKDGTYVAPSNKIAQLELLESPEYQYRKYLESQPQLRQGASRGEELMRQGLQYADVATDLMQMGNFLPFPQAQLIGKIGNVAGSLIDGTQAAMDTYNGDYGSAIINAGSSALPSIIRNPKVLGLKPRSAKYNFGNRSSYLPVDKRYGKMTEKQLLGNRALLGTLGAETVYDAVPQKEEGGWLQKYQDGGDEAVRKAMAKGLDTTLAYGLKGAKWIGKNVFGTDDIIPDVAKDFFFDRVRPVSYPTDIRQVSAEISRPNQAKPTRDLQGDLSMDEEAWSRVLNRPTKSKYFTPSEYKPTTAADASAEYYQLAPGVIDEKAMKKVLTEDYFKKNGVKNSKGNTYVPMTTLEPFISKEFMRDYKKYANLPFSETDPLANFQVYQGKDPKTGKRYLSISDVYDFGLESANEFIKPMNIYQRVYKKGGQSRDEREMVNGIADILTQVRDKQNREQIARQMMADFERDDVTYDPQDFRELAELKYGGHGGLDRWFAEKWVDVKTGKACGRKTGESRAGYPACRPSKRVTSDTPKTSGELSASEKARFKREKTSSNRISYNHKKEDGGQIGWLDKYN